jgi:hypothetical protein
VSAFSRLQAGVSERFGKKTNGSEEGIYTITAIIITTSIGRLLAVTVNSMEEIGGIPTVPTKKYLHQLGPLGPGEGSSGALAVPTVYRWDGHLWTVAR